MAMAMAVSLSPAGSVASGFALLSDLTHPDTPGSALRQIG